ncbi:MAG TPA: bifunctional folylpolyglutamate synthase/dihydrofolate synthase [Fusobacteriaceae bacterium]|nr:bifunctional folylpolyglutamate synthase/dihydrofolate synthase [Fusobacteriaceae bacterium]
MNIDKTLEELYSLTNMGIKLGLDNIKNILKIMGNPQDNYKILHIAGTNGKGSTASILEGSLLEAGYKVGKYTSPHIEKFNERIVVNKKQISDEKICFYYKKIRNLIEVNNLHPTFFEITTAMMFDYFKDCNCEYVVLETGLGGRFDATNICHPEVSIITNISMDHVNILGDNLTDIAREKCGIIKDSPVVIADSKPELIAAVEEKTKDYVDVIKKYNNVKFELTKDFKTIIYIDNIKFNLSLYGKYQVNNFLGAYEALKKIGISDKHIQDSVSNIYWPGRFEIYSKEDPLIILDGAHNVDAASKLKENILSKYKKDQVITLVSILKDKDRYGILKEISNFSNNIIFTSLEDYHRGSTGDKLIDLVDNFEIQRVEDNIIKAFDIAKKTEKIIVVCGSFYLLSKFKKNIQMR